MRYGPRVDREPELYAKASSLAVVALGYTTSKRDVLVADQDPLAWWELTDAIVKLAKWFKAPKPSAPAAPGGKDE